MSRLSFALLLTVTLPLAPLCTGCTEEVTIAAPLDAASADLGDGARPDGDARARDGDGGGDEDGGEGSPCQTHSQCGDGLCASNGRCVEADDVAHVSPCSGSGDGSRQNPHCSPSEAEGGRRPFMLLAPGTYDRVDIERSVRIYGSPGTIIERGSVCSAIKVKGAPNISVEIVGLEARGQVLVEEGSTLTLRQLVIGPSPCVGVMAKKNVHLVIDRCFVSSHTLGGAELEDVADYVITNSYFVKSGHQDMHGTVYLEALGTPAVFANNTVADNDAGVTCSGGGALLLNTIVWGNQGTAVSSNCTASHSDIEGGVVSGPSNISVDPAFVGSGTQAAAYRLGPGSPCIDAGAQSGDTPALDYDGEQRTAPDIGADERL